MLPDEPNDEERLEELPADYDTPFRPANPSRDEDTEPDSLRQSEETRVLDTHPATDTDLQLEGLYDSGVNDEAQIQEPNAGNAVVDYHPPKEEDS